MEAKMKAHLWISLLVAIWVASVFLLFDVPGDSEPPTLAIWLLLFQMLALGYFLRSVIVAIVAFWKEME
jgi:hypothetical protein